ncbi:FAD-binding protein, partial [Frankia sp. Cpl3]|nr:FAD-binding protein [Frankia sp. Cpl3]
ATKNETILPQHSKDESHHSPVMPDVVVYPISTEEVSAVLHYANEHRIPVVPFGVGSSLEGHCIPLKGGISLDFQLMNQVIEIRPKDFLVRVQPGVTRTQLNQALKKHGLFFPVDPGADATLGGMAATNASGTTSVRYGIMRNQVRDLEVVLADGTVIHTGGLAAKSSSGYHLTSLFVGSEGTLGIFTELTLKVYGIPETILAGRATFPSVKAAVDGAISLLSAGISIARVELVDSASIKQVNKHSETDYPEEPTLFFEFHGNEAGLTQDISFAQELLASNDCRNFLFETDSKQRAKLW